MPNTTLYKISFVNQNKIYEIYAKSISQDFFGFVRIADIVFDANSAIVLDPSEEKLKNEFEGVKATLIPMHAIFRIDEVEKRGTAKIKDYKKDADNIMNFPSPIYTSPDSQGSH